MMWRFRRKSRNPDAAPASLGPLTVGTAVTAAYLATSPIHYWPLDETSGTSAADLVGALTGTCTGMTMGGADAPQVGAMIGTKAPTFDGTAGKYITVNTDKTLGGLNAWTVAAWVRYNAGTTDNTDRAFYGESASTFSHDWLSVGAKGGTSVLLEESYGADAVAVANLTSSSIFIRGGWAFVVFTRSGSTVDMWWNLGRRMHSTSHSANNTWTDSTLRTRIGAAGNTARPWQGEIAHLAIWNRVLGKDTDMRPIYEACTPQTRTLTTKKFFAPTAVVNQDLTVPGNAPAIVADGGVQATKLANQVTNYGTGTNESTGPFYTMPAGSPTSRVRIAGGQNNIAQNPMDLWTAFGVVPVPASFVLPVVSDREAQVYAEATDELWEFIQLQQTLSAPDPASATPSGAGTLPAGLYVYAIMGCAADGTYGQWSFPNTTVNGSQGIQLAWRESEGAHHYQIFRLTVGNVLPWGLLTTVPAGTFAFFDDGSHSWTPNSITSQTPTYVSTDWGCSYGGYLADTDHNLGYYPSNHANWGASASGMPLWSGSISLHEAINTATDVNAIPHALAMAVPEVDVSGHVYPALRNDGFGGTNAIKEGTRFQLDPAYDISQIPFAFDRAVAKAMQKYGMYVRDVTQSPSIYVEMNVGLGGRDFWADILEGRHSYEAFGADGSYTFPWAQTRVVDPAWTLAQTAATPPVVTPPKIATFTDDFDHSLAVVDAAKWPVTGLVSVSNGQARIACNAQYQGGMATTPNAYDLTNSALYVRVVQVPFGDASNEGGLTLFKSGNLNCFIEMIFTDAGLLACGYMSSAGVRTRVVAPSYVNANHAWWRIRHASGTVYWEASANGTSWTILGSVVWTTSGWTDADLQAMTVKFFAGNFGGVSSPQDFVIDNVNVASDASSSPAESHEPNKVMAFVYRDGQRTFGWVPLDEL